MTAYSDYVRWQEWIRFYFPQDLIFWPHAIIEPGETVTSCAVNRDARLFRPKGVTLYKGDEAVLSDLRVTNVAVAGADEMVEGAEVPLEVLGSEDDFKLILSGVHHDQTLAITLHLPYVEGAEAVEVGGAWWGSYAP